MDRVAASDRQVSPAPRPELRGRAAELDAIQRLLADARGGRAGILVVIGDPGVGKSALLEHGAALGHGMRVLRCAGVRTEAALPFAGLLQLLRPILDLIERLPAPQAAAIRSAFGLSAERVEDRFLISVAVLGLLSEAAEELPLLCLVDEVQWLDHESLDALAFAARRLEAEPIAFLIAMTEETTALDLPSATQLRLAPLADDDALAVVRDRAGGAVSATVAARIVDAAGGDPLLLTELVASLSPEQLKGRSPLPDLLPLGVRADELYLGRMRELPAESRTALLVAAAEETESLAAIAAALRVLGHDVGALEAAERAGLVDVADRVTFRRPLIRSVVYASESSANRRRVHRALASVLTDESDRDRRAWHRAAAAIGPDESVALELDASASRVGARSGCAAAATALERAARLSADETARARRLARAAEMAWLAGQAERASALAAEAEAGTHDAVVRARVDFVRAASEAQRGVPGDALPILLRAADAVEDLDPEIALRLFLVAVQVTSTLAGQPAPGVALGRLERLARRSHAVDEDALRSVLAVLEWREGGGDATAPGLGDASVLADRLDDPLLAPFAIITPAVVGDLGTARINAERAVSRNRAAGAVGVLPFNLQLVAFLDLWARRFDLAQIHAAEGLRLALETGQENLAPGHHALLAMVAAVRGEEEACRREAEAAMLGSIERGLWLATDCANLALGHLELALGRSIEALERFDAIRQPRRVAVVRLLAAPDAVEAAVRAGRRETAESCLRELEEWTAETGAAWSVPLVARCRALLTDGAKAERLFSEALALHETSGAAFDRARTQLLLGQLLRRSRRRSEARAHLRAAVETFASVGSALWEERARQELRAAGEVLRRRQPAAIWQLTPQELQIARLVGTGATNRDVAAQLYLSPRTVEYHLRKIFTKLGISSRLELVRMPLVDGTGRTEGA